MTTLDQHSTGEVILSPEEDGAPAIEVRLEHDSVWLSQQQIAELFRTTRENVTIHLRNVDGEGELTESATRKESLRLRTAGIRSVRRRVLIYILDAIISVGYRVKRNVATQFRIWATERLREFLLHGYALHQQRLVELGTVVQVLSRSDDALTAVVATISEGFDGTELYVTTEGKAANLRYSVVKDHPLVDGNRRSAAALFVTFLARNGILNRSDGTPRIANNALAAATLMIAMSNPGEKRLMVALPLRMLVDG